MLRRGGLVPEIKEGVVDSVEEKLRSTTVGGASVSHGAGANVVGDAWAIGFSEFIGDGTVSSSCNDTRTARDGVRATTLGATSSCSRRVGVL